MNVKTISMHSENFGQEIVDSFVETGFAVVTDHPLSQRMIDAVYEDWKNFFSLPYEAKLPRKFTPETQSGWFPPKAEKAKDAVHPDMKEFYHFYKDREPGSLTGDLAVQLEKMAISMLALVEQELRNRGAELAIQEPLAGSVVKSNQTLFRLLHYPPTQDFGQEADLMERASAHEDINLITLLPAATNPGLQVKDVHGNLARRFCGLRLYHCERRRYAARGH